MKTIKREGVQTYKSNTFRVFEDEDEQVKIEFGTKESDEKVLINASTQISPKMLVRLAEKLILLAAFYEEKHNVNLGLNGKFKIEFEEGE